LPAPQPVTEEEVYIPPEVDCDGEGAVACVDPWVKRGCINFPDGECTKFLSCAHAAAKLGLCDKQAEKVMLPPTPPTPTMTPVPTVTRTPYLKPEVGTVFYKQDIVMDDVSVGDAKTEEEWVEVNGDKFKNAVLDSLDETAFGQSTVVINTVEFVRKQADEVASAFQKKSALLALQAKQEGGLVISGVRVSYTIEVPEEKEEESASALVNALVDQQVADSLVQNNMASSRESVAIVFVTGEEVKSSDLQKGMISVKMIADVIHHDDPTPTATPIPTAAPTPEPEAVVEQTDDNAPSTDEQAASTDNTLTINIGEEPHPTPTSTATPTPEPTAALPEGFEENVPTPTPAPEEEQKESSPTPTVAPEETISPSPSVSPQIAPKTEIRYPALTSQEVTVITTLGSALVTVVLSIFA
jgi:hypothetical protein